MVRVHKHSNPECSEPLAEPLELIYMALYNY
jgi:hypothetical protein